MKKREKKMQLHRETVLRLNRELDTANLANARGGEMVRQVAVITSCIGPDCCGSIGTE